ncbi:gas vesicle protein GvpG [Aquabacter spiritensis]|uniref:Gas vesicle protein GvpG n=1 Tax=Aquabacter spiritensis TaxID=933073 RepID=A0A4R3LUC8_9HYPH|nr:gas vesicle protein GvpG [Aquabacter spiritensis]TCT02265.1 gas vesicle protein GvpG [Aquabacter spiritensis]
MSLVTDVLFAPAVGPLKGVLWLARLIAEQAERTLYDEDVLRAALLDLEQRFEAGEISEADYETEEDILLARLKIARERMRSGL